MKDEDYLVYNLNKIANELKHINWNLGKIMAFMTKDKKVFDEITNAENLKEENVF